MIFWFVKNLSHQLLMLAVIDLYEQNVVVRMTDEPKVVQIVDEIVQFVLQLDAVQLQALFEFGKWCFCWIGGLWEVE